MNKEVSLEYEEKKVELAKAMIRLKSNPDFQLVFDEKFFKDWALTQTYNVSTYTPQSRIGVMEQMHARSVFMQFCDELIEDGKIAVETVQMLKEEAEQLGNEPTE